MGYIPLRGTQNFFGFFFFFFFFRAFSPYVPDLFFFNFIIYLPREESTPSFSVALHAVPYFLLRDPYAFEVKLSSVHPFYQKKRRLRCKNQVSAVFSCHLLL